MQQQHEYTVIPAPARGEKARGARSGAERFAHALTVEINRMAAEGWEYIRAETLPCEERSGLTSRTTVYHNVLVFRRRLAPLAATPPQQAASRSAPPVSQPLGATTTPPAAPESPAGTGARTPAPHRPDDPVPDAASPLDDLGVAPGVAAPAEGAQASGQGLAPAFVQRPPLAARPDMPTTTAPGGSGPNGARLGPAAR